MRQAALVLIALVVFLGVATLAACGGDDEDAGSTTTEETVTETDTTVTETHEDETETHEGSDLEGDPVAGKSIFLEECASCHTLADTGTTGTIGPNLDESKPGFEHTVDRVTHGRGVMPAFEARLSEQEIADVATYVSENAGS